MLHHVCCMPCVLRVVSRVPHVLCRVYCVSPMLCVTCAVCHPCCASRVLCVTRVLSHMCCVSRVVSHIHVFGHMFLWSHGCPHVIRVSPCCVASHVSHVPTWCRCLTCVACSLVSPFLTRVIYVTCVPVWSHIRVRRPVFVSLSRVVFSCHMFLCFVTRVSRVHACHGVTCGFHMSHVAHLCRHAITSRVSPCRVSL